MFVGTPDHIESRLAAQAGYDFIGFPVSGFDKAHPLSMLSSGVKLLHATREAKKLFKDKRPDAVATFGAYVSIPVGRAAFESGIPLVIHEQNAVPGMANEYLAKHADAVAVTYPESLKHLHDAKDPVVTGNPVRRDFECVTKEQGRRALGISEDATVLMVMGGSLGAQHVNDAVMEMKEQLLSVDGLEVVWSTGESDYERVLEGLDEGDGIPSRIHVHPYIDSMSTALASADLVVSRAGASSLAEIMTMGVPSILIPYPHARGDHQTLNAKACVEAGAARLIPDDEIQNGNLAALVMELVIDENERDTMHSACLDSSGGKARVRLADIIEGCARKASVEQG